MPLPLYKNNRKVFAVAAGKGGVGKSTLTVNLAFALKEKGFSVGILDADVYGPSLRRMLPEDRFPSQQGETIIPALCCGMKMISMAYFRKENEATVVRAPIATGMITQFLKNVNWDPLDILLIDFPPGTGDIQLTLAQQANLDGAILITTPQEVAVMDVRKAMDMFHQVKVPVLGLVENMSYFESEGKKHALFGEGGGKRLSDEQGVPFLGQIPLDPVIGECGDKGLPLLERSASMKELFTHFAEQVLQQSQWANKALIKTLKVEDGRLFITWFDELSTDYGLTDLQKKCPCAGCQEKAPEVKQADVSQIYNIGRYALRLEFKTGCSSGIYSYDYLRELAGRPF